MPYAIIMIILVSVDYKHVGGISSSADDGDTPDIISSILFASIHMFFAGSLIQHFRERMIISLIVQETEKSKLLLHERSPRFVNINAVPDQNSNDLSADNIGPINVQNHRNHVHSYSLDHIRNNSVPNLQQFELNQRQAFRQLEVHDNV